MSSYISNIYVALLLFPFLSALLVLPYAIYQFRKYGSIPWWKTTLVFTFIFYLMCAYFMVILPLPADRDIYIASVQQPQLVPFKFLGEMAKAISLQPLSLCSWVAWLKDPAVYTVLFNFLLTAPFGAYLRYLFSRPWWQSMLAGFALALFFEVSQGSGLFGIYTHPYRLFDVDDLITNTSGVLLGYLVAIPLCHHLPSIDRVNALAIERAASRTSFTRRALAFLVDCILMGFVAGVLKAAWPVAFGNDAFGDLASQLVASAVVFMLMPCLIGSATPGHRLLKLRVVRPDGTPAPRYAVALRYFLLFWCFLLVPRAIAAMAPTVQSTEFASVESAQIAVSSLQAIVSLGSILWWLSIAIRAIRCAVGKGAFVMVNGLMTNTCVYSLEQIGRLEGERAERAS